MSISREELRSAIESLVNDYSNVIEKIERDLQERSEHETLLIDVIAERETYEKVVGDLQLLLVEESGTEYITEMALKHEYVEDFIEVLMKTSTPAELDERLRSIVDKDPKVNEYYRKTKESENPEYENLLGAHTEKERKYTMLEARAYSDAYNNELIRIGREIWKQVHCEIKELRIDPKRIKSNEFGETGIMVRAKLLDGSYGAVDIVNLEKESLLEWLRSNVEENKLAENVVGILFGHGQFHLGE